MVVAFGNIIMAKFEANALRQSKMKPWRVWPEHNTDPRDRFFFFSVGYQQKRH